MLPGGGGDVDPKLVEVFGPSAVSAAFKVRPAGLVAQGPGPIGVTETRRPGAASSGEAAVWVFPSPVITPPLGPWAVVPLFASLPCLSGVFLSPLGSGSFKVWPGLSLCDHTRLSRLGPSPLSPSSWQQVKAAGEALPLRKAHFAAPFSCRLAAGASIPVAHV